MKDVPTGRARPSIYLATPAYGGLASILFFRSLLNLQAVCAERGVPLTIDLTGGDALITRARSRMATQFLEETDFTHLLFIDADIGFRPEQVFRLLEADRDVVGGVYPFKRLHWDKLRAAAASGMPDIEAAALGYVVRFLPSETQSVELDRDEFGPVAGVGTGFMLIRRQVLERLRDAHPELRCVVNDVGAPPKEATLFFDTLIDPTTREHLSEDYAFCQRWRDLGGQVFADFRTRLSHIGHAVYTGSLVDAVRT